MRKKTISQFLLYGICPISSVLGVSFTNPAYSNHLERMVFANANEVLFQQQISGSVNSNAGLVDGATVRVKERPEVRTITDSNGQFTIKASVGETLVISAVGYVSQEIKISTNNISVQLSSDNEEIDEVIVTGYTAKKKSEISSAVSYVSGAKLNDVTSRDLGSLLQGKIPGLVSSSGSGSPTSANRMILRGQGTINASSSPLVVVDGNIGGTYMSQDVESVTVLRDAAATGLYGSRAANGVIIVTTKRGKIGETAFSLNPTFGVAEGSLGKFKLMNSQQLYDYQKLFMTSPFDPSVVNTNTNWVDLAFRKAKLQNHSMSASGGSEKTQFYISGVYFNEEGTVKNTEAEQFNVRANISSQLTNKLRITSLINGRFVKDTYNDPLYSAFLNLPYDAAYNDDGSIKDPTIGTWYGRDRSNFLYEMQYNYSRANSNAVSWDLNFDYNILDNLVFSTYNRATVNNGVSSSYSDKRSKSGVTNNGEAYKSSSLSTNLLTSNRLRYQKDFGKHSISGIGVFEIERYHTDNFNASIFNLPPGRDAFTTGTENPNLPRGDYNNYMFSKMLAQFDYSYSGKYYAVASLVNEFSSRFGENNPSATFYQLGASWLISNEGFMKDITSVDNLRLRLSNGTTGNADGINNFASLGLYDLGVNYAGLPGAAPGQMANPNLTWEKSTMTNIGVDLGLFNRVDLSVDLYRKDNSDLLFNRTLSSTTGYKSVYENVGKVRNQGLEISLNTINVKSSDFQWNTSFNIAFNQNEILELDGDRKEVSAASYLPRGLGRDMYEWFMPIWAGVNPENGDPLWENIIKDADGKEYITYTNNYNQATRQYTGKRATPKFTGGFGNDFTYKNFTLNSTFSFVSGNHVYNTSRFYFDNDGVYETYNQMVLSDGWSRWEKPGDIATHPKPIQGGNKNAHQQSSRYLEDGSFLRLRNVTLGYNLPKSIIDNLKIKRIRLYVSGDNLWTSTKFSGIDPEVDLSSGSSYMIYPPSKRFMFGMNVTF